MSVGGWIGVDLDGTLAEYGGWKGADHIGAPIPKMMERVHAWLEAGVEVKIFTARVAFDEDGSVRKSIENWAKLHIGRILPITHAKDYGMIELWDDRCVQVIPNTGRRADGQA